jgi:HEAT repeat protein
MTKRRRLEERLAELNALRADPTSGPAMARLRQALASKTHHLAAKAARMAGEFEIGQLGDDLVSAFERFMVNPSKSDEGCVAKTAIAEALYRIGYDQESLFLRGIRHIQLEPAYGGKEDTAARLRVTCALGLVRTNTPEVMIELAHLLADAELDARIGAVRAIAYAQQDAGVPLLRFKALIGDEDTRVMYECFGALLQLAPESSLPFVAGFLDDDDVAVCEAAAIALGESRLDKAFDVLKIGWEKTLHPALRRTGLLAIAMLRHERAIDFLLSVVADASPASASDAIVALEMYRRDEQLWQRVQQLVEARGDIALNRPH